MPGLWKAWKAKGRLPTLSTSPLEISPTTGEIPTFPQRRRLGRGKVENQKQVFHFPTAPISLSQKYKSQGARQGCRPPTRERRRRCAPPPKKRRRLLA